MEWHSEGRFLAPSLALRVSVSCLKVARFDRDALLRPLAREGYIFGWRQCLFGPTMDDRQPCNRL